MEFKRTFRNLCFTCYATDNHDFIQTIVDKYPLKYYIYQLEKCPSTEKLHFQGFLQFEKPVNRPAFNKFCAKHNLDMHNSEMYSTVKACKEYCAKSQTKIDGPWEKGEASAQGKKPSTKLIADMVLAGATDSEIALQYPDAYMRLSRQIKDLRATACAAPRNFKTRVIYCVGESGAGKSAFARRFDEHAYYKDMSTPTFWDNYQGQEVVVLDDLRGSSFPFNFLLRLWDRYPVQVQVKGSAVNFAPRWIIATSVIHPKDLYSMDVQQREDIQQLLRRIDKVLHFTKKDTIEETISQFDCQKIREELSSEFDKLDDIADKLNDAPTGHKRPRPDDSESEPSAKRRYSNAAAEYVFDPLSV